MVLHNFIVFEGIDGAGTSTQIEILKKTQDPQLFFYTAEPTNGPTGVFLRTMLKGDIKLDPRTAAYLFAADRNEHLYGTSAANGNIEQLCKDGKIVVSDRYLFSSLAYQSIQCGIDLPYMLNQNFPLPELLFFFEIESEQSLKRITGRGVTEIYEKADFLKKTEEAYKKVIASYEKNSDGMKIVYIDATKSKEEVANIILENIKKLPIYK